MKVGRFVLFFFFSTRHHNSEERAYHEHSRSMRAVSTHRMGIDRSDDVGKTTVNAAEAGESILPSPKAPARSGCT